jgi:hypothetical protein
MIDHVADDLGGRAAEQRDQLEPRAQLGTASEADREPTCQRGQPPSERSIERADWLLDHTERCLLAAASMQDRQRGPAKTGTAIERLQDRRDGQHRRRIEVDRGLTGDLQANAIGLDDNRDLELTELLDARDRSTRELQAIRRSIDREAELALERRIVGPHLPRQRARGKVAQPRVNQRSDLRSSSGDHDWVRCHTRHTMPESDPRLDYPATERNREAILAVLRGVLRDRDRVLEIGSGSGQHAAHFARHWPTLHWQPSEVESTTFASIEAWSKDLGNVSSPRVIDVTQPIDRWSLDELAFDAVFSANVIHIAPWEVCVGLLAGAGALLEEHRPLVLYGPFMRAGRHTAASNEAFDRSLRARDPRWGVRDLDLVILEAARHGLEPDQVVEMPANNLTVVLRRS